MSELLERCMLRIVVSSAALTAVSVEPATVSAFEPPETVTESTVTVPYVIVAAAVSVVPEAIENVTVSLVPVVPASVSV